jgi:exodeoxyribonuclease-3
MKLISWNVNGIRAVLKKDFLQIIQNLEPDIVSLQEVKAREDQLEKEIVGLLKEATGVAYHAYWNSAVKKGYSGTLVLSKVKALSFSTELQSESQHADDEGRIITLEFPKFFLVNVYTPNAKRELTRLDFRVHTWDQAFREHLVALDQKKPVIFCGDLNVAHQEIDLANPKSNKENSGFTQAERDSFSETLAAGFVDSFRHFHSEGGHYSWWSHRPGVRARNIGWRIDYFCVSEKLVKKMESATIHPHLLGSDHCPVELKINL